MKCPSRRWLLLGAVGVCLLAVPETFAGPAEGVPGEQVAPSGYVGTETCLECHDEGESFSATLHGRADLADWSGAEGCESCHGPGEAHAEEGDIELIVSFADVAAQRANEACLSCHEGGDLTFWHGSTHETFDVTCTSCHKVHQPWTSDHMLANRGTEMEAHRGIKRGNTDLCLSCHEDQRKHMYARSSHPLRFGQMSCDDCHSPHGSPTQNAVAATSVNDKCYECHAEKRGPFLWEHAPVRDNCLSCHDAHGSNQKSLLTVAAPRLCQSCHLFGHHQTVPGLDSQVWNLNRSCVNCHPRIHGSNHPSGIVLMR